EGGAEGMGEGRGRGQTRVFGLAGEGSKFVYVLDRSGSMTTTFRVYAKGRPVRDLTPLELAKAELLCSLRELAPEHEFQIVFYNIRSLVFSGDAYVHELLPAT